MPLHRTNNSLTPFPSPYRNRNIYYPNVYSDPRTQPYSVRQRRQRAQDESPLEKRIKLLKDKVLDHHGDLGWTLDYATAYAYKRLLGNQTGVRDAIDTAREYPVDEMTPFGLFDLLDKDLFAGKLKAMVYLKWAKRKGSAPGMTSTPGVLVPRISIELNSTPFVDGDPDIDDLLDVLIHQMIHAYFLVCCGAQPKGSKQDGRLLDGIHFGVILRTIRDISKGCEEGPLKLIFHSAERRAGLRQGDVGQNPLLGAYGGMLRQSGRNSFISLDTKGAAIGPPPADGCSHCSHENGHITLPHIKNWQVECFQVAIDLELDEKGDTVYNLEKDALAALDRLKGPPSATYVELIWDKKRIMVNYEKAVGFSSLKKPIQKDDKRELKLPDCKMDILNCIWDFLNHGSYWKPPEEKVLEDTTSSKQSAPVLKPTVRGEKDFLSTHIRVFKAAESMKFEELQSYALKRMYEMLYTSDDPITALKELYNDGSSKPVHSELHRWARKFLVQTELATSLSRDYYLGYNRPDQVGTSNLQKLIDNHGVQLEDFRQKSAAFRDDFQLAQAELAMTGTFTGALQSAAPGFGTAILPMRPESVPAYTTAGLNYPSNPYPQLLPAPGRWDSRAPFVGYGRSNSLPPAIMPAIPVGSDPMWDTRIGRDGRERMTNRLTGERWIKAWDPYTLAHSWEACS